MYIKERLETFIFSTTNLREIKGYKQEKINITQQTYYKYYENIIRKIQNLLKKLNLTKPSEIKIVYEYLLFNGYLSNDKTFIFSNKDKQNIYFPSISIFNGNGVCLNISDLLNNIYKSFNYESYLLTTKLNNKNNNKKYYKPNINRKTNIIGTIPNDKKITNKYGNHTINIVCNNDEIILCDPTNLDFINVDKKLKGNYINRNITSRINVTFFASLENKINEILYLLNNTNQLNLEQVKQLYENILTKLNNYTYELNLFHKYIESDIENICKTLKK